jgi:hypothetical protein
MEGDDEYVTTSLRSQSIPEAGCQGTVSWLPQGGAEGAPGVVFGRVLRAV